MIRIEFVYVYDRIWDIEYLLDVSIITMSQYLLCFFIYQSILVYVLCIFWRLIHKSIIIFKTLSNNYIDLFINLTDCNHIVLSLLIHKTKVIWWYLVCFIWMLKSICIVKQSYRGLICYRIMFAIIHSSFWTYF